MRSSKLTIHYFQKVKAGNCLPSFTPGKAETSFAVVFCSQPILSREDHEEVKYMTFKKTFYICLLSLVTALLVLYGCASSSSTGTSSGLKAVVIVVSPSK